MVQNGPIGLLKREGQVINNRARLRHAQHGAGSHCQHLLLKGALVHWSLPLPVPHNIAVRAQLPLHDFEHCHPTFKRSRQLSVSQILPQLLVSPQLRHGRSVGCKVYNLPVPKLLVRLTQGPVLQPQLPDIRTLDPDHPRCAPGLLLLLLAITLLLLLLAVTQLLLLLGDVQTCLGMDPKLTAHSTQ
jgi:hypothetical protein